MIADTAWWIALERADRRAMAHLEALRRAGTTVTTSAGVVGQVWRGGPGQARVATMLQATDVVALTEEEARQVGVLLGEHRASDVVDGHVAIMARRHPGRLVATADRRDLEALGVAGSRILEV